MKKTILGGGLTVVLASAGLGVQAALVNGSVLQIDEGVSSCIGGGAYPDCNYGSTISSGSYFELESLGQTPITGVDGVILGSVQPYDFSYSGGSIDQFLFIGASGMHYTTNPTNVLSASGNTATVDFSGWSWTFNNAGVSFNLGTGTWGANPDAVANIVCGVDCSDGDTYTLYYTATVPEDEPNGYAGFAYELSLIGTVSAVPVPAAIWLFGSSLLGLLGMGIKKKS